MGALSGRRAMSLARITVRGDIVGQINACRGIEYEGVRGVIGINTLKQLAILVGHSDVLFVGRGGGEVYLRATSPHRRPNAVNGFPSPCLHD